MAGHIFIIRGDLRKLACDAWLMPCSRSAAPDGEWFLNDHTGPRKGEPFVDDESRSQRLPGNFNKQPQPWITRIGAARKDIQWYVDGASDFLRAASDALAGQAPLFGRPKHLLALPLVGTGKGGAAKRAGDVVQALLPVLRDFVEKRNLDVALVCWTSSTYAAAQAERERCGLWPAELTPELRSAAELLAKRALKGELALFLGAGVSMAAGLPDWKGLLRALAKQAQMSNDECEALAGINTLDQATIIERRLGDVELGATIKNELGQWKRYSLTHALLAALPVREVITTNYDQLFEAAWGHSGSDDLTILPTNKIVADTRRWLLKMHGCVSDPSRIVLSRASYTRYDEKLPALAGMVQAFLITRHVVFVGFSLTDDNFHRIVDAVRRLMLGKDKQKGSFGTSITLGRGGLAETIWDDELHRVWMMERDEGAPFPYAEAARRQQIFFDYLLSRTRDLSHLLVGDRFNSVLSNGEKRLRDALERFVQDLTADEAKSVRDTVAWNQIKQLLESLGCDLDRHFPEQ